MVCNVARVFCLGVIDRVNRNKWPAMPLAIYTDSSTLGSSCQGATCSICVFFPDASYRSSNCIVPGLQRQTRIGLKCMLSRTRSVHMEVARDCPAPPMPVILKCDREWVVGRFLFIEKYPDGWGQRGALWAGCIVQRELSACSRM